MTVLLKLLLDETEATVRQRRYPIDGEAESRSADSSFTLAPKRGQILFGVGALVGIDISTIAGVQRSGETDDAVVVHHLNETGRLSTGITPESDRGARFLQTYLQFRSAIVDSAGPIRFLFVGEDKDSLALVAKLLNDRNLPFEAAHATTSGEALDALANGEGQTECIVSECDLEDTTAAELRSQVRDVDQEVPMVYVADTPPSDEGPTDADDVVDVITVGSRTEHYEDVVDALERAVLAARLDERQPA